MVDKDLLAAKLAELADRVARVRRHVPSSAAALAADRDALDIVSFNLMLAVQVCADVASHLIADAGWPPAGSLAESFSRLEEHGVLTAVTAEALRRAVGLRNVVAHGYARLDVPRAFDAASFGTADLERFAQEVGTWAQATVNELPPRA
jgi:uncharacterized protein YutE (UPF0331/DUF86 family)